MAAVHPSAVQNIVEVAHSLREARYDPEWNAEDERLARYVLTFILLQTSLEMLAPNLDMLGMLLPVKT
jgi:hypothetical protein